MAVRRKYTREFKQEAIQLVRSADVRASQIARDLGIDPNMLSRWCREMGSIGNIKRINAFSISGKNLKYQWT